MHTLADDQIHVWYADLDMMAAQTWQQYLSPDEYQKASTYYFLRHRQRYVAGRGLLRALIGSYISVPPEQIRFAYNEYGKPALLANRHGRCLSFNVSHSEGAALFAFAWNRDVGVDIEQMRTLDMQAVAEYSFSTYEKQVFYSLPSQVRPSAFFTCWTRKEAFIKAVGKGLSLPLTDFDVSLSPNEPARLLRFRGDQADYWSLQDLTAPPGYKAALAAAGDDWDLEYKEWGQQATIH